MSEQPQKPKLGRVIEGAEQLSLGISIVVAVLMGVGLGILRISHLFFLMFLIR